MTAHIQVIATPSDKIKKMEYEFYGSPFIDFVNGRQISIPGVLKIGDRTALVIRVTYIDDSVLEGQYAFEVVNEVSNWAVSEIAAAEQNHLIPDEIKNRKFTKDITREEFAMIAIRFYEEFTGDVVRASRENPFTDTENKEVLKAYKVGITL